MSDVKISALTANTAPVSADVFPMVETATTTTKKVSFTNLVAAIAAFLKTLTNTTFDTAGSGNVFKINGTSITDKTGTGKAVLDTSPTIASPTFSNKTSTGTDSGAETLANKTLSSPTFSTTVTFGAHTAYFTETDNGNSSTSDTIDWGTSNKQKSTLTGNCTFTFTAPGGPCSLVLKLVQDGTGSRTVTWPATVHWASGVAPVLTTINKVDIITFYYDGTTYFGSSALNFTA